MLIEFSPVFFGLHRQLEHHGQRGAPRAASFRELRPMPDRGKGRFDWIGRPNMNPMFGREVIKVEQDILVFLQAFARLGIF